MFVKIPIKRKNVSTLLMPIVDRGFNIYIIIFFLNDQSICHIGYHLKSPNWGEGGGGVGWSPGILKILLWSPETKGFLDFLESCRF